MILSVADMRGDPSVLCGVFGMVCNGFGARTRPPAPERRLRRPPHSRKQGEAVLTTRSSLPEFRAHPNPQPQILTSWIGRDFWI